jgi:hypothetical protein
MRIPRPDARCTASVSTSDFRCQVRSAYQHPVATDTSKHVLQKQ